MRSAVYNLVGNDGCERALALSREAGVERVTLDPVRGQVVVRYLDGLTDSERLRRTISPAVAATGSRWITWWPRLARIPGALARFA